MLAKKPISLDQISRGEVQANPQASFTSVFLAKTG